MLDRISALQMGHFHGTNGTRPRDVTLFAVQQWGCPAECLFAYWFFLFPLSRCGAKQRTWNVNCWTHPTRFECNGFWSMRSKIGTSELYTITSNEVFVSHTPPQHMIIIVTPWELFFEAPKDWWPWISGNTWTLWANYDIAFHNTTLLSIASFEKCFCWSEVVPNRDIIQNMPPHFPRYVQGGFKNFFLHNTSDTSRPMEGYSVNWLGLWPFAGPCKLKSEWRPETYRPKFRATAWQTPKSDKINKADVPHSAATKRGRQKGGGKKGTTKNLS